MANYFPLIVDAANSTIDELPAGDNLNLANSGIVNAGNITANFFIGDGSQLTNVPIGTSLSNGNSSVNIPVANGNVNVTASGNANILIITGTGVNVAGTLNATGNANVGNVGATNGVFTNVSGNGSALSSITGANVTGTVSAATTAGTVTTAAQPNITSVGTLTSLDTSGNAVIGGNLTVNGNLVYVNVETLAVEDPIIQLQSGPNGAAPASNSGKDVGTGLNYYDTQARVAFMGWDVSNAEFGMASQASITSEVVTFTAYGNLRVGNIIGNGQALTGLAGANVTGAVAFATTANAVAGANVSGTVSSATTAATVTTNAQPNITSVGTLSSLTATGNVAGGNLTTGGAVVATGNVSGSGLIIDGLANVTGNAIVGGIVSATGNVSGGNLTTAGALSVTGNANVGNIGATNGVFTNVSGNGSSLSSITGANVTGAVAFATTANAVAGANVSGTVSSATTAGTVTTAAQPNITSVGTLSSLSVTGNLSSGNANLGNLATANFFSGDGSLLTNLPIGTTLSNGNSNVSIPAANGNVNISSAGNANIAVVTGTGVNVAGTLNVTGNIKTGPVVGVNTTANAWASANVVQVGSASFWNYLGETNMSVSQNYFFDGTNYKYVQAGAAAGYEVQGGAHEWKNAPVGVANANVTLTTRMALDANGNLTTSGRVAATGNVSGANLTTAGVLEVTGNANVGNIGATNGVFTNVSGNGSALSSITGANVTGTVAAATTAGTVTTAAQPNITSVGTLSSLSVTGNITGGNLNTSGNVNAPIIVSGGTGIYLSAGPAGYINFFTTGGDKASVTDSGNIVASNLVANSTVFAVTANISGNVNAGNVLATTLSGNVISPAQTSITSLGTLTGLAVNGNITAANITANTGVFTGNGSGLSAIAGANVTGTVANATFATSAGTAGTVTTSAQPNITSVGTLTSLGVNGTVTAVAFTANTGVFTGNGSGLSAIAGANVTGAVSFATTANAVAGANVSGQVSFAATANAVAGANVSGQVANALVAGTVYTAAQPNITSVGTLTSVSVTGNVAAGNLTTTGVLSVTGTGVSSIAGNLDMTSNTIINLATPTNPTDAATKQYVDDVAQGLHTHDSCNAATQTTLATISGGTVTYNNGTSGVGATLTTTGSYTTIDGVTLSNGMRILVKNEANTAHNGIYDRTSTTVLTRSDDFNTPTEMAGGDFTFVSAGTLYDNTGWVMPDAVPTVGTSPVVWVQFSGAGTYTAGTGLTLTGNEFSVNASQTQVTAVGTLTGLNSSGTITAPAFTANTGVFTGNGAALTNLNASNVSSGTLAQARLANSNVILGSTTLALGTTTTTIAGLSSVTSTSFVGTLTGAATTAGTVTTAAQPNITSVGTLTSLGVSGTVTAPAFTANTGIFTGNGAGLTNIAGANVTGTVANATFATSAGTAGTVTTAAQPNITSVGTLTGLGVNGTITGVNITANTGVFTGNGSGLSAIAGANVTGTVANATFATSAGSATTAGTVTTAAQPNITSVGTLTSLGVNGTITGTRLISNIATGTAPLTVTSTTQVANLNVAQSGVTDTISVAAGTGNNFIVFASAATGNVNELTSTGLIANLSNNSITATTFVGSLSGAATSAGSATTAGTVTTAAQPNITSVGTLTSLAVTGNISGANLTGTHYGAATGLTSIPGANVTGTVANATFATSAGSATTAGTVTTAAQPNITSVGTLTGLTSSGAVSITNSTAATSRTTGALIVTGGIGASANSFFTNLNVASNIAYVAPNGANTINSQMLNGGTLAWSGNAGQLFSITDSMTGNIFTVNDVSGIPMISVDAGGNIQFAASGGFVSYGVTTGITAAGSTQGTATALTRPINVVSTVSASTGVILPTVPAGARILVMNTSGTALNVYPPSGAAVNSAATNAAYSQPAGARLEYVSVSATQWYTLNATYG